MGSQGARRVIQSKDLKRFADVQDEALCVKVANEPISTTPSSTFGAYTVYEDSNFTTGESPRDLDVNTDLGRNADSLMMRNDGLGDIGVQVSDDGVTFSDVWTLLPSEIMELQINIDTVRLTWVADTSYRIMVI